MRPCPEISVLLVAHNAGQFLEPAVRSILRQEGVTLELVLVDNASTDGSVDAAVKAMDDERLRVIRLAENRFHAGGLRAGLPECRAPLVAMMDADDVALPARLARQRDEFRRHGDIDLVGCAVEAIDAEGRILGPWFTLWRTEDIREYSLYDMPFPLIGAMGRAEFWQRVGWREEFKWAFDLDFIARAVELGQVRCIPEVLYRYRIHPRSVSQSRALALLRSASYARLATGRRRRGRPEGARPAYADIEHHAGSEGPVYAEFARRYRQEGLNELAAMYARRAWNAGERWTGLCELLRAVLASLTSGAASARRTWRVACLGPAHALRVASLPPLPPRRWTFFKSQRAALRRAP